MAYDQKLAARIRKALESRRDVAEVRMFGGVTFMVRGHMSCGIIGSKLMLRLDPADAEALLRRPNVRPMDFTRRPMPGFLYVDPPGIATAPALTKWVGLATAYAESKPRKAKKPPRKEDHR